MKFLRPVRLLDTLTFTRLNSSFNGAPVFKSLHEPQSSSFKVRLLFQVELKFEIIFLKKSYHFEGKLYPNEKLGRQTKLGDLICHVRYFSKEFLIV